MTQQTYSVEELQEMLRKSPKIGDGSVQILSEDLRFNAPAIAQQLISVIGENERLNKLMELRDKISFEYEGGALTQIKALKSQVGKYEFALKYIANSIPGPEQSFEIENRTIAREALDEEGE